MKNANLAASVALAFALAASATACTPTTPPTPSRNPQAARPAPGAVQPLAISTSPGGPQR